MIVIIVATVTKQTKLANPYLNMIETTILLKISQKNNLNKIRQKKYLKAKPLTQISIKLKKDNSIINYNNNHLLNKLMKVWILINL